MILEQLSLTDFRVFKGQHTFDLSPRTKYKKKRPIILYGGLNGAGKTTTLTAVRLALYGKQSLGLGTSQKAYEDFLVKNIHISKDSLVQANSSSIELSFNYAAMGEIKHYKVKRSWMNKGKKVVENLSIIEDEDTQLELSAEQCQGFLNELIPIGVSDLFFFDSEKIADLAEDTSGMILGDAIKKLLGLDLIDTLNADLGSLLRSKSKESATVEAQKEIHKLENDLQSTENLIEKELFDYEISRVDLSEIEQTLEKLENDLSAHGGAWAASREEEIKQEAALTHQKQQLSKEIIDLLDGNYPFSLAKAFVRKTLKQIEGESKQKRLDNNADFITEHIESLSKNIQNILDDDSFSKVDKAIQHEFHKVIHPKQKTAILHDISDSMLHKINIVIDDAINEQSKLLKEKNKELKNINHKLDMAGKRIARAPEESSIKPYMDKIKTNQDKRAKVTATLKTHIANRKRLLDQAIDITKQLDKLSALFTARDEKDRLILNARNSRSLLSEFAKEMANRKIKDLEHEFVTSYNRLARKEDIHLEAEINPNDFSVKLIDENKVEISKDALSAGEKQIYAISILEALARTSGRKLPIIIDTPLARLDSVHRTKLINNYFPYASHQVIILSTDTEVDESFYDDLSPHISHAYKLDFNTAEKCTTAKEGYFWKHKHTESA